MPWGPGGGGSQARLGLQRSPEQRGVCREPRWQEVGGEGLGWGTSTSSGRKWGVGGPGAHLDVILSDAGQRWALSG